MKKIVKKLASKKHQLFLLMHSLLLIIQ